MKVLIFWHFFFFLLPPGWKSIIDSSRSKKDLTSFLPKFSPRYYRIHIHVHVHVHCVWTFFSIRLQNSFGMKESFCRGRVALTDLQPSVDSSRILRLSLDRHLFPIIGHMAHFTTRCLGKRLFCRLLVHGTYYMFLSALRILPNGHSFAFYITCN